jgi:transposase
MYVSDHSLSQLDEAYVQRLDEGPRRGLSLRLLDDLKEARERLRQNPRNRSRPPSRRAPWDQAPAGDEAAGSEASSPAEDEEAPGEAGADATPSPKDPCGATESDAPASDPPGRETPKPKRNAGKQPGAPGMG